MRSSHGPSGSASPLPTRQGKAKRRVVNLAPCRKSCSLRVDRKRGGENEPERIPPDWLHILQLLGAQPVGTEAALPLSGVLWHDWWRVPIAAGKTFDDVARLLRSRGLTDIHFGTDHNGIASRVSPIASGAGPEAPGKYAAIRKAAVKEEKRAGFAGALLCTLFGDKWMAVVASLPIAIKGDFQDSFSVPTGMEKRFQPVALWNYCCDRLDVFPAVYRELRRKANASQDRAELGEDVTTELLAAYASLATLERWVREVAGHARPVVVAYLAADDKGAEALAKARAPGKADNFAERGRTVRPERPVGPELETHPVEHRAMRPESYLQERTDSLTFVSSCIGVTAETGWRRGKAEPCGWPFPEKLPVVLTLRGAR